MSNEIWQLPNKSHTDDPDLYGNSWAKLGQALELILGEGWRNTGFRTMQICMAEFWVNNFGQDCITKNILDCSVETTQRLIEIAIYSDQFQFNEGEVLADALEIIVGE